jgi:hypothetical protein
VFPNLIYINLFLDGSFHGWDDVAELLRHSSIILFVCLFLFLCILLNVIYDHSDSGGITAHLRNGNAKRPLLNVFHLTSDHVLFQTFKGQKMIFDLRNIFCRM